jgi:hypothetical protein
MNVGTHERDVWEEYKKKKMRMILWEREEQK